MSPVASGEARDSRKAKQVAREIHGCRPLERSRQSSTADFMNANDVSVIMSNASKSRGRSSRIMGSSRYFALVVKSLIQLLLQGSQTTSSVTSMRTDGC